MLLNTKSNLNDETRVLYITTGGKDISYKTNQFIINNANQAALYNLLPLLIFNHGILETFLL